ncbi:MAG: enoyl-CoA hydratase-related protein [Bacteroidota bacterium]
MTYKNILTQLDNGILTITINRPDKLNALNRAILPEIKFAIQDAYQNDQVKGIIITGAGEKAFVAGADISEFVNMTVEQGKVLAANGHEIYNLIENCPKPVIAAVNGFALGGGCELAMACHIRVASENAMFGQPEVNLGLIPGYGGTQRLIQLIGKGKAFELLMTAGITKASDALDIGLVNYVTTPDELIPRCIEIIEKINSKSPVAIKGVIKCVNAYFSEGIDGFETEIEEFGKCCETEDFIEGTTAFLEKRKANFPGK